MEVITEKTAVTSLQTTERIPEQTVSEAHNTPSIVSEPTKASGHRKFMPRWISDIEIWHQKRKLGTFRAEADRTQILIAKQRVTVKEFRHALDVLNTKIQQIQKDVEIMKHSTDEKHIQQMNKDILLEVTYQVQKKRTHLVELVNRLQQKRIFKLTVQQENAKRKIAELKNAIEKESCLVHADEFSIAELETQYLALQTEISTIHNRWKFCIARKEELSKQLQNKNERLKQMKLDRSAILIQRKWASWHTRKVFLRTVSSL